VVDFEAEGGFPVPVAAFADHFERGGSITGGEFGFGAEAYPAAAGVIETLFGARDNAAALFFVDGGRAGPG
jgi:hypothetical protein